MRVKIDAGGRAVEIECADKDGVSVQEVADVALDKWKATEGVKHPPEGPGFGFTLERRGSRSVSPMAMGNGWGWIADPVAKEDQRPD